MFQLLYQIFLAGRLSELATYNTQSWASIGYFCFLAAATASIKVFRYFTSCNSHHHPENPKLHASQTNLESIAFLL